MKRTSLYDFHRDNAKLVDFGGYDMPIWYTTITEEHMAVRDHAGIFDVSHMGRVNVVGSDATKFVESLFPSDIANQPPGKCTYTLMLNEAAGIIDDLIVSKMDESHYLLVINAANHTKDLGHIHKQASGFDVEIGDVTGNTTMIAVQGPSAADALQPLTTKPLPEIKRFTHASSEVGGCRAIIARTGYTGEDGFEIILQDTGVGNPEKALAVWNRLAAAARPCGLGARDSLRLEAGLPLYGSDLDETTNPIEADLRWVVSKTKQSYVGGAALSNLARAPPRRIRRGIILEAGIPRRGFEVTDKEGRDLGSVTSGTFSPVLKKGIAMAYMPPESSQLGSEVEVIVREAPAPARVVKPPFYDDSTYGWKRAPRNSI
jgi:aminomethyltransferase